MNNLHKVADTVLDQPIKLEVDFTPQNKLEEWGQKLNLLPKKKTFYVQNITLRNLIRISRLLLSIDMTGFDVTNHLQASYKAMDEYSEVLARIVAIAINNKKSEPSDRLVGFIMDQFTAKELEGVLMIVVKQMSVVDFIKSIISIRGMNILERRDVNAPSVEVNPPAGEKIAPGI